MLVVEPVPALSNEVRINAGVKPVDGPGSEKRSFFFRDFRGVVAPTAVAVCAVSVDPLDSETFCFVTWLLVRDAGQLVSASALEMALLRRFRVSRRCMLTGLAYQHAADLPQFNTQLSSQLC